MDLKNMISGTDIRGIVSKYEDKDINLSEKEVEFIAKGFGLWITEKYDEIAKAENRKAKVAVGYDARHTGPKFSEVIRKTLDASIEGTGKGVIYITDFNYSNDLTVSKYAPIILNKLSGATVMDKEAFSNRPWADILKEFHIKDVTVVRDMSTMIYGIRDAVRIEFDEAGCRLANLEEDTPSKLTYLNLLAKFFRIAKDAIFV